MVAAFFRVHHSSLSDSPFKKSKSLGKIAIKVECLGLNLDFCLMRVAKGL
jgi:hypothetical protein